MSWCWLDGRLTLERRTMISAFDRGFMYGDGVYETFPLRGGHPVRFTKHMDRAEAGAAALGFGLPYGRETLRQGVLATAEANRIETGVVRMTISRGVGERGFAPPERAVPTTVIRISAGPSDADFCRTRGLRAVVLPWPRNERSPLVRIKSLNCLENVLGAARAREAGADEGVFLNTAGNLAEGTKTNLFVVRNGVISTPPVEDGLLPGIVRQLVISLFSVAERSLTYVDLREADEAFLTNSLLGAVPLIEVDGKLVGTGSPGPVTTEIAAWLQNQGLT